MRKDLHVFTEVSETDARQGTAEVTVQHLDHTAGVLEFGGNVILLWNILRHTGTFWRMLARDKRTRSSRLWQRLI
jgi:hypothetical protein